MSVKVAINGFGRIGRLVMRAINASGKDIKVVLVNDLSDATSLAHLLKYDSVHGRYQGEITVDGDNLVVDGNVVKITAEKDPSKLPMGDLGVDVVVESTGVFRAKAANGKPGYDSHLASGARKVVLTVPAKDEIDAMVVLGVNDDVLKPEHKCVSNASCTTNCLAPVVKVLDDAFGVSYGLMTTVHGYTNDQRILDLIHSDRRRMRAAALNIIPSTTGAAKAVGKVIPSLNGKLNGMALRVPVPDGSCIDLVAELKKSVSAEEINAAFKAASEKMPNILGYNDEEMVSSDIVGDSRSSVFDAAATMVMPGTNMVKVISWYDNEWGYSSRVVDLVEKVAAM
jgi:glyceraldehyde 3-phosphate dehydrogenase